MDKQKEIAKMEVALNSLYRQDTHEFATALVNNDIGDVKQEQRELLKKLKMDLLAKCVIIRNIKDPIEEDMNSEDVFALIDKYIKELE